MPFPTRNDYGMVITHYHFPMGKIRFERTFFAVVIGIQVVCGLLWSDASEFGSVVRLEYGKGRKRKRNVTMPLRGVVREDALART